MKGTIDQVEAFFAGLTSIWQRILGFFVVCWLAAAFAYAASKLNWAPDCGWTFYGYDSMWQLTPVAWMFSITAGTFLHWWGLLFTLFLLGALYCIVALESGSLRFYSVLFALQCWHTLGMSEEFYGISFHQENGLHLDSLQPLVFVTHLINLAVLWLAFRSWRHERAEATQSEKDLELLLQQCAEAEKIAAAPADGAA